MLRRVSVPMMLLCASVIGACDSMSTVMQPADQQTMVRAQVFEGLVTRSRPVTTESSEAQQYFDQGMTWMYAFNHDEAVRSFTRATELDPECAMAWWGISVCNGPNYNDPVMTEERSTAAWDAIQQALAHLDDETAVERALINALSQRYQNPWPEDRTDLDKTFADAMADVWSNHPNDTDIGTLYAESMMVQMPWMLYKPDFTPAPDTPKIVATLERVLELEPYHPGANHLYIHAVEPSANPDSGLVAAERLGDLVPASGHLLHMPSHIYVKTGRWSRAIEQNVKAMESDDAYRAMSPDQGIQHMYMVHNSHMLAYAAMMSGREKEAIDAARSLWEDIPEDVLPIFAPYVDLWMCSPYDVQKRFGRWDDILAEDAPPTYLPTTRAVWRAHRAVAYAAKKEFDKAKLEHQLFREEKESIPADQVFGLDSVHRILEVSDHFVAGEIALQQGDDDEAVRHLVKAAEIEDTLSYGEPPQWLQPVRHTLGAVYMKSGRYAEAERTYREDLKKWRNNGWSLYGLSRALEAQGKFEEAARYRAQYEEVWSLADAPITTSCVCIPEV